MTQPSKAAMAKAWALTKDVGPDGESTLDVLARYIQTTSDVVAAYFNACAMRPVVRSLAELILPDEPDPLTEIIQRHYAGSVSPPQLAHNIRNELAKRGGRIVFDD